MRKYIFVLFALLVSGIFSDIMSQTYRRQPLPDWIFEKPERSNKTFYYHVEKGVGETETEARNAAYTQAFMQVALKLGIPLNTEDINDAIASGTNVKMLSQRFTIPINVACYCSRRDEELGGWNYWLLCQIPEIGHADNARFDDYNECFVHKRYDALQEEIKAAREKQRQDSLRTVKKSNARALAASAFIPGLGQMLKKQGGSGTAFLLSEVVVFGGGTFCYFMREEQTKIIKNPASYEEFKHAQNLQNIYNIAMYTAFGIGAAIHIGNMVHAWIVPDKRIQNNITFVPALIPTNDFATPSYAWGAGVQIKF